MRHDYWSDKLERAQEQEKLLGFNYSYPGFKRLGSSLKQVNYSHGQYQRLRQEYFNKTGKHLSSWDVDRLMKGII